MKTIRSILLLFALALTFAATLPAQITLPPYFVIVYNNPTGACSSTFLPLEWSIATFTTWYCNGSPGVWTQVPVSAGGTVTSVGLQGTANQITVTGASPVTGAGSWTLSFPAGGLVLPGTTTGTFKGNLTGNADTASGAPPTGSAGGDLLGTYPNPSVAKVNGNTPGGTCTNQLTRSIDTSGRPFCATVANADLANPATSVNSQTCTLGGSCTVTAAPSGLAGGKLSGAYPDPGLNAASTDLSDSAGLVRGAASLTTDHKAVAVSTTDGSLEEIPNQNANTIYGGPSSGAAAAPGFRAMVDADLPTGSGAWHKYSLVSIANGVNTCANANGCWQVNGVYNSIRSAALTQNVVLFQLPAKGYVENLRVKTAVACTGATTAVTGAGSALYNALYRPVAFDIAAAVSDTNLSDVLTTRGSSTVAAVNVVASLLTTTGAQYIDTLAADCAIDYWFKYSILP